MRLSKIFTKTQKFAPQDEVSKNAQLLIRAGYIYKEMAGVYTFLPLGWKVIQKISQIIREEMDKVGGLEMRSATLQDSMIWKKTNRWDGKNVDNWFKTKLKKGGELGLAFTHEEAYTVMMKNFIASYKDLPAYPYDIRTIFRNEVRAKSGIMRGREFYWKALYSFSKDEKEHQKFYEKMKKAYQNIFQKVGLGDKTYLTFASGGSFSKYSHEFQTISEAGEDTIYLDEEKKIAINKEVFQDKIIKDLGLTKENLKKIKAIEVGNIFTLGYKFSEPLELTFKNEKGKEKFVFMGSYGMGISRLMGTIAEVLADERGLVWPKTIAPYQVYLINIGEEKKAQEIYQNLQKEGIEVLWDDRLEKRPGEKFADADLVGLPYRVVISDRSMKAGGVEFKKRTEKKEEIIQMSDLINKISK